MDGKGGTKSFSITVIKTYLSLSETTSETVQESYIPPRDTPKPGDKILVYRPIDKAYCRATVQPVNQLLKNFKLLYDDGEKENIELSKETWKFEGSENTETSIVETCKAEVFKVQDRDLRRNNRSIRLKSL